MVVFGKDGCESADEVGGWLAGAEFGEVVWGGDDTAFWLYGWGVEVGVGAGDGGGGEVVCWGGLGGWL